MRRRATGRDRPATDAPSVVWGIKDMTQDEESRLLFALDAQGARDALLYRVASSTLRQADLFELRRHAARSPQVAPFLQRLGCRATD